MYAAVLPGEVLKCDPHISGGENMQTRSMDLFHFSGHLSYSPQCTIQCVPTCVCLNTQTHTAHKHTQHTDTHSTQTHRPVRFTYAEKEENSDRGLRQAYNELLQGLCGICPHNPSRGARRWRGLYVKRGEGWKMCRWVVWLSSRRAFRLRFPGDTSTGLSRGVRSL